MKFKFSIRDSALYNKVWVTTKSRLSALIRGKCEKMSHRNRITVVTVLLTAFVLCAFFVFGHACYKLGQGEAGKSIEIEHIQKLELVKPTKPLTYPAYAPETEVE